jgi:dephospho-CoA kinase|tara:strand:+ start:7352 stop:7966 length:615 start_codon:yes stop_codon:yes gene_type:complete
MEARLLILGLTGSIGMGKSTAADMLRILNVPVHDSDAIVSKLLESDKKVYEKIRRRFPSVIEQGVIKRKKLGDIVFSDNQSRVDLENIIHPFVRMSARRFLRFHSLRSEALVVLDIPLLYETKGELNVDAVLVMTAPEFIRTRRVLSRSGMSIKKFKGIVDSQISDKEKCRRADFIVETGLGKAHTFRSLKRLVKYLRLVSSRT